MCCQYGYLPGTLDDIYDITEDVSEDALRVPFGDIRPSDNAVIIKKEPQKLLCASAMPWGFLSFDKKLLINARAETVFEKKSFAESALKRRCIIPAACFYEWDRDKVKNTFMLSDHTPLFLAGFYNMFDGADRFIIITTEANETMAPVHDRMPLIFEKEEIEPWIFNDSDARELLKKTPAPLERTPEYEQLSLF